MTIDFSQLMREATRLTQTGQLTQATQVIQRAMSGRLTDPPQPAAASSARHALPDPMVLEGCVAEVLEDKGYENNEGSSNADVPSRGYVRSEVNAAVHAEVHPEGPTTATAQLQEQFLNATFAHDGQLHHYKLYVPPARAGQTLSLVVLLHGCTQNPDDFSVGTGMNALAREQGFFVLYPAQAASANAQRCWNWFDPAHQQRGRGEPGWIAALTRTVVTRHGVDANRVFAAGLSAGGAMAAVLGAEYPDLYSAVGVHSGLPVGAASNLPQALAAMKRGSPSHRGPRAMPTIKVPTIIFHGDQDRTVHPRNAEQFAHAPHGDLPNMQTRHGNHTAANGRRYTVHTHLDRGHATVERWQIHGAGHAWSGGNAGGSYTDPRGPDASAEMLRFFLAHPLRARA